MSAVPAMPGPIAHVEDWPNDRTPIGLVWDVDPKSVPVGTKLYALATLQAQPAAPGVTGAVQTLIEALKADPEYAWAWHCNVAMAAVDEGLSHYQANKAAARFLSWLAQIDTTTHPGFPQAPAQPAEVSDAACLPEKPLGKNWHAHYVLLDKAALQMIRNALRNDVERGLKVRGEMLEQLDRATLALRPQAVPSLENLKQHLACDIECSVYENTVLPAIERWEAHHGITAPAGGEVK